MKWAETDLFLKAELQRGEIEIRRTHPTGIGHSSSDPITPTGEREQRPFLRAIQEKDGSKVDCVLFDSNETEASTTPSINGPNL